jgi:hypothetical protein
LICYSNGSKGCRTIPPPRHPPHFLSGVYNNGTGGAGSPAGALQNSEIGSTGSVGAILWEDLHTGVVGIQNSNEQPNAFIVSPTIGGDLDILIGDFSQLLVAIRTQAHIEVTREAASAFEKHQVLVKITLRFDSNLARGGAFHKLTGITT